MGRSVLDQRSSKSNSLNIPRVPEFSLVEDIHPCCFAPIFLRRKQIENIIAPTVNQLVGSQSIKVLDISINYQILENSLDPSETLDTSISLLLPYLFTIYVFQHNSGKTKSDVQVPFYPQQKEFSREENGVSHEPSLNHGGGSLIFFLSSEHTPINFLQLPGELVDDIYPRSNFLLLFLCWNTN
uniref:Uncharacterized protein n=1 Tax=Cucumis melo TaxID=3656 RepID=A0A9I9EKQ7_CUCME